MSVLQLTILNLSVLQHEGSITFSSEDGSSLQQVICVSVSISEDRIYNPDRKFLVTFEVVNGSDRFEGLSAVTIKIIENGEK